MSVESPQTTPGDYACIFEIPGHNGLPCIVVGGQAVNFWALHYLEQEPALKDFFPFTSNDLDLYGTLADLLRIASATGCSFEHDHPRTFEPRVGVLYLPRARGAPLKIEILQHVYGVNSQNIEENALFIKADFGTVRILNPLSLLKAKLENALNLPQEAQAGQRNDVRHLKIMLLVTRAYLRESILAVEKRAFTVREHLDRCEIVMRLSCTDLARRAVKMYGIQWSEAIPIVDLRKSREPRFGAFVAKRWPQYLAEIDRSRSRPRRR